MSDAQKRKRSPSPSLDAPSRRLRTNGDSQNGSEKPDQVVESNSTSQLIPPAPQTTVSKLNMARGGGAYIPPHRMRAILAEQSAKDTASVEFQRLTWEALRKSINGLINKVNVANIKFIIPELFGENLIRGRGLFARSVMRAQASSLPFTPVFACLVSIINSKLPTVGALVLHRLIIQFRRAFKRNDKVTCTATLSFLGHLANQKVIHILLIMEVLQLLLDRPTDDSVEIAVGFTREVGALLQEEDPKFNNALYEMYRDILHSSEIDKRVQFMVEVLFQVRKEKFKDNPILPEGLDLVEEDDLVAHEIGLADQLAGEETLNIFKADPDFETHEQEYKVMKEEILGGSDDEGEEEAGGADQDSESDSQGEGVQEDLTGTVDIHDHTGQNIVNLRRRIYLTIMSALDFEEAVHKLLQIQLGPGEEIEMCNMIVECCSQERTYSKFFGLMAERLSKLQPIWSESFETAFRTYYTTIHRYETNRLRNIARLFGHLIGADALPWTVFDVIKLNEDETSSSSRIFIKIMTTELVEMLGLPKLRERFSDPLMRAYYDQMFPLDNPKNTRFSINFWTSIGMGILTETMREHLKNVPAQIMAQRAAIAEASDSSDSDSDSSDSDSSTGSTDSRDLPSRRAPAPRQSRRSPEPAHRPAHRRPLSRSPSPPHRRSLSPYSKRKAMDAERRRKTSRSPPPVRRQRRPSSISNRSRSRSPPRAKQGETRAAGRARATDFYDEVENQPPRSRR